MYKENRPSFDDVRKMLEPIVVEQVIIGNMES